MPLAVLLAAGVEASFTHGATFQEGFSSDPLAHGWRVFGNSNLFRWNPASQNLDVTWDSSQSNSYFQLPLGTIVARSDDFSFALDLHLDDITAGVNPDKPSTFELAFGLQNTVDAEATNFFRGDSRHSPNLVEFDFFPDTGFGPTIWPSLWSTNSILNYNGTSDYSVLDLPVGVTLRIALSYSADTQTLLTTITTNGVTIGVIHPVPVPPAFADFRLGAFALSSYTDTGQRTPVPGSLLAHGTVDNIVVTVPPAPVGDLRFEMANGARQVQFVTRSNWVYTLERSEDLQSWTPASPTAVGTGTGLLLQDTNAPGAIAFYRVRAERP